MSRKKIKPLFIIMVGALALIGTVSCRGAQEQVQILAPDVEIHLGDQNDIPPPWRPLYHYVTPSTSWQGEFYVREPGDREWLLTMDVLQLNDWGNIVRINDQRLQPSFLPGRDFDFASTWSRVTFVVPPGVLRPELNVLTVEVDQSVPVFQTAKTFWEDLQFRNITLRPK